MSVTISDETIKILPQTVHILVFTFQDSRQQALVKDVFMKRYPNQTFSSIYLGSSSLNLPGVAAESYGAQCNETLIGNTIGIMFKIDILPENKNVSIVAIQPQIHAENMHIVTSVLPSKSISKSLTIASHLGPKILDLVNADSIVKHEYQDGIKGYDDRLDTFLPEDQPCPTDEDTAAILRVTLERLLDSI